MKNKLNILLILLVAWFWTSCSSTASFPLTDSDIIFMHKPYHQPRATVSSYVSGTVSQNSSFNNGDKSTHASLNAYYSYSNKQFGGVSFGPFGFLGQYEVASTEKTHNFMGVGLRGSFDYNLTPHIQNFNFMTGLDYAMSYEFGDYANLRKEIARQEQENFEGYFNISGGIAVEMGFLMSKIYGIYGGVRNILFLKEFHRYTNPYGFKTIFFIQNHQFGFFYQFENITNTTHRSLGQFGVSYIVDQIVSKAPKSSKKKRKKKRKKSTNAKKRVKLY